jgi:hypothetical protein
MPKSGHPALQMIPPARFSKGFPQTAVKMGVFATTLQPNAYSPGSPQGKPHVPWSPVVARRVKRRRRLLFQPIQLRIGLESSAAL